MADPLSLTAGIIAVLGVGNHVVNGLKDFVQGFESADQEIISFSDEIEALINLLRRVKTVIERVSGSNGNGNGNNTTYQVPNGDLVHDILDICGRVLPPLSALQSRLNRYRARMPRSSGRLKHFRLVVRWMFRTKQKLLFFRDAIQSQAQLLNIVIPLLILQSLTQNSLPAEDRGQTPHYPTPTLANTVATISTSREEELTKAVRSLTQALQDRNRTPSRISHQGMQTGSGVEELANPPEDCFMDPVQSAFQQAVAPLSTSLVRSGGDRPADAYVGPVIGVPRPKLTLPAEGLSEDELNALEKGVDRDLGPEPEEDLDAMEIFEDLGAVVRKVIHIAEFVLWRATTSPASSFDHHGRENPESHPSRVDTPRPNPAPVPSHVNTPHPNPSPARSQGPSTRERQISMSTQTEQIVGDLILMTSDGVEFLIPKDMVEHWDDVGLFVSASYPLRSTDAVAGLYHLLSEGGAVVAPAAWSRFVARDSFTKAYMIFNGNHTSKVMNEIDLVQKYHYLTDAQSRRDIETRLRLRQQEEQVLLCSQQGKIEAEKARAIAEENARLWNIKQGEERAKQQRIKDEWPKFIHAIHQTEYSLSMAEDALSDLESRKSSAGVSTSIWHVDRDSIYYEAYTEGPKLEEEIRILRDRLGRLRELQKSGGLCPYDFEEY